MIEILDTIASLYLVVCPLMTLIFVLMGWLKITFTKRENTSVIYIIAELVIIVYYGWIGVFKELYRQYKEGK